MNQSALQTYLTQQVMSASPAKLVAMLHDKAISSLQEAVAAIEAGDIQARHNANRRAIDIVAHLWGTLDLEQGGQIADNLHRIYDYMMRRLSAVDFKNEAQAAREVIALLDPLRKSWHELAKAETAPEAPGTGEAASAARDEAPGRAPSGAPAAGSLTISA